jgi:photosystem II stability/assembly factor-like uncharacterized protein
MVFSNEVADGVHGMTQRAVFGAIAVAVLLAGCGFPAPQHPASAHLPRHSAKKSKGKTTTGSGSAAQSSEGPAPTAPPPALQKIDMLTQSTGWTLLSDGEVLRTSSGGAQWTNVTPSALQNNSPAPAQVAAAFPDAQHAVLLIGKGALGLLSSLSVYATSDGGASWTTAAVPLGQNTIVEGFQVRFVSDQQWYVLLHEGGAMGSEGIMLLYSADGALHWAIAANGTPAAQNTPLIFRGSKSGFGFLNPEQGWLTGDWPASSILLYATSDGGKTWRYQNLAVPPGLSAAGGGAESLPPAFFGTTGGVLPVLFGVGTTAVRMVFYRTSDGGAEWTPTTPVPVGQSPAAWSFPSPQVGFVAGISAIYRTTDGGADWSAVQPAIALQNITELDFVSAQTGWAVVSGTLLATSDGARTWTRVPLLPSH